MSAEETSRPQHLPIKVEFSGGLEMLFSNQRKHDIKLPIPPPTEPKTSRQQQNTSAESSSPPWTVARLIDYLYLEYLNGSPRAELFIMEGTVRPGILVLINDADWELEGEGQYILQKGDNIMFMSTLHGG